MMRFRFPVFLPLTAILASGCMNWHAAPVPPPRQQGDSLVLGTARLTLRPAPGDSDPRFLTLRDIQVHGDSVVGLGRPSLSSRRRIAVHRDQVTSVEFRRPNRWGTVAVVVLPVVAVFGAIAVVMSGLGG